MYLLFKFVLFAAAAHVCRIFSGEAAITDITARQRLRVLYAEIRETVRAYRFCNSGSVRESARDQVFLRVYVRSEVTREPERR